MALKISLYNLFPLLLCHTDVQYFYFQLWPIGKKAGKTYSDQVVPHGKTKRGQGGDYWEKWNQS